MFRKKDHCDQIIFNILICLPLDVIHNVMKYVCKDWYNMIHSPFFIYSHLKKSTSGLLVQRCSSIESGNFVKTTKCEVEAKEMKFQFPGVVLASCNGLVLIGDDKEETLYVTNPFINQQLILPKIVGELGYDYGFAYTDSSRVYKVVRYAIEGFGCEILTLGVDKAWRSVDTSNLTSTEIFHQTPLSVGGFVHSTDHGQFVFSLEVETETFKKNPFPVDCLCHDTNFKLSAMGSSLSLILSNNKYVWEIWLLMDLKTGHWIKLYDIDLQGQRCLLQRISPDFVLSSDDSSSTLHYVFQNINCCASSDTFLCPLGWSQNGEVLVFRVQDRVEDFWIIYNVKTRGVHLFQPTGTMKTLDGDSLISHAHVHSLVPLNIFSDN